MKILITAGNTLVPIDKVRSITNIFTGKTGTGIALHCHQQRHDVKLLTSHPEVVHSLKPDSQDLTKNWQLLPYQTFDDLQLLLEELLTRHTPDVVIHSAAVSDYRAAGIFAPNTTASKSDNLEGILPRLSDVSAGKVKSNHEELWLRLVRTPKLVDKIRSDWKFSGILVKFKLEVGIGEDELLRIAEASRRQSDADLMVANTLEEAPTWAYLGPVAGRYEKIARADLPAQLLHAVEDCRGRKSHG